MNYKRQSEDYCRIEQALIYLEQNFKKQPELKEIAKSAFLSEYHFQRLFSRWVGISPKRFLKYLTKEYAKKLLETSRSLLDVTYKTGLSSPSRLHDLFITCDALTPGEYKNRGEGVRISYGLHPCIFGECLLAVTDRGICWLAFVQNGDREGAIQSLKTIWGKAVIVEDPSRTQLMIDLIFNWYGDNQSRSIRLFLKGTNFQIKVWEALLRIPLGAVVSYEDIARTIGMPNASRAVGNAVGKNPISFLIPCHRVIKKIGEFGHYGGGKARKKAILGWEAAKYNESTANILAS